MSYRVNPALAEELAHFGGDTLTRCFNCGNCTAVCGLSKDQTVFPRKIIRYMQLGLEDKLLESPEPWLCYYCGTCSDTCPREAQPGELMMATRRWLTSRYDWTGLSKRLYLSEVWEVGLLSVTALLVLTAFIVPGIFGVPFGFYNLGEEAMAHVRLDLFAPTRVIHYADWALAAFLLVVLGANALRMIVAVRRGFNQSSVPLITWLRDAYQPLLHLLTQKRWLECDNDTRMRWLQHFLLVTGYATMFLLVVGFLPYFQREDAEFHWTALLGYYATAVLLWVTVAAMRSRWRKTEQIHKFSQITDWMFLVLLFLTALSGILLHLARLLDWPLATYVLYVVHLMIAVSMLVIEVPFGKWLHLVFRPVAKYMVAVREAAVARPVKASPHHALTHG
ncbi:MAG: 4Fe-4S ferredoxin [Acidobacteria bacterium]|nr:MAG: 4Fe-4S ferredoxin [Acidobacteriota bacterium]